MQITEIENKAGGRTQTLNDFATKVAQYTGGKVVFLSPGFAIVVRRDGCEVELPGPTQDNWYRRCIERVADAGTYGQ